MRRPLFRLAAFVVFVLAALAAASAPSSAQSWPTRPVRFIIPLGAGSGVDITARVFADKLSAKWGQPVVVENKPGGDAIIAITAVIGAHDDHVLLFAPASTFTAHPLLHEALGMHVFSVLSKPVDLNVLLDALARVMKRHYEGRWPTEPNHG